MRVEALGLEPDHVPLALRESFHLVRQVVWTLVRRLVWLVGVWWWWWWWWCFGVLCVCEGRMAGVVRRMVGGLGFVARIEERPLTFLKMEGQ